MGGRQKNESGSPAGRQAGPRVHPEGGRDGRDDATRQGRVNRIFIFPWASGWRIEILPCSMWESISASHLQTREREPERSCTSCIGMFPQASFLAQALRAQVDA